MLTPLHESCIIQTSKQEQPPSGPTERMVESVNKLEEAEKAFLKVRDSLLKNQEGFALARAYKKPWKWYREHTTQEAIEILRKETHAEA